MGDVLNFPEGIPKFYEDFYVVHWRGVDGIDEFSIVLLSLSLIIVTAIIVTLLYARSQISVEENKELALQRISIYFNVCLSHWILFMCVLCSGGTTQTSCLVSVLSIMFSGVSCVTWLMIDSLSLTISQFKNKQYSTIKFCLLGYGFPLLVTSVYIACHFAMPDTILTMQKCWFRDELVVPMTSTPLTLVFLVHLLSVILANNKINDDPSHRQHRKRKALNTEIRLVLRCSNINFLLLTIPIYGGVMNLSLLWLTENVLIEYILVASLSLQSILMLLRYIIFDPIVKNSIVDRARQIHEEMKEKPIRGARIMYIP